MEKKNENFKALSSINAHFVLGVKRVNGDLKGVLKYGNADEMPSMISRQNMMYSSIKKENGKGR